MMRRDTHGGRTATRDGWYPARLLAGWSLLAAGLVTLPLPLPTGLILIFLGLGLLARDSRGLRLQVVRLGRRYPRARDHTLRVASSLSRRLGNALRETMGRRPRG